MHCELIVAELLPVPQALRLPALELCFARGRRARTEPATVEDWLARACALEAGLPAGALSALAAGLAAPAQASWIRADPVHLEVTHEGLRLVPPEALAIDEEEARSLAAALETPELAPQVVSPGAWVAATREPPAVHAPAPLALAGRTLTQAWPTGADAPHWHARLVELQMALARHPVNQAREARSAPAINSLWLWGAGTRPPAVRAPWASLGGADLALTGLARAADIGAVGARADAEAWLAALPGHRGRHAYLVATLRGVRALASEAELAAQLLDIESRWVAPLLAALRAGRIGMLTLHLPEAGLAIETVRSDLRRIWRRPQPLAAEAS